MGIEDREWYRQEMRERRAREANQEKLKMRERRIAREANQEKLRYMARVVIFSLTAAMISLIVNHILFKMSFITNATHQLLEIAFVFSILWCVTMLGILFSVYRIKKNTGIIVISLLILFNIFWVTYIIHLS